MKFFLLNIAYLFILTWGTFLLLQGYICVTSIVTSMFCHLQPFVPSPDAFCSPARSEMFQWTEHFCALAQPFPQHCLWKTPLSHRLFDRGDTAIIYRTFCVFFPKSGRTNIEKILRLFYNEYV